MKKKAERILKLDIELQARCGDGLGKITSHSINCRCEEINKELDKLRNDRTN